MGEERETRPTAAAVQDPQDVDPQVGAAPDPTSRLREAARRAKAAWCFLVSGLG